MRVLIFAAGVITDPQGVRQYQQVDDIIIAADGGARHCQALGIQPHTVIGDFDSLTPSELDTLEQAGVQIMRYPMRKDLTDLELALHYAAQLGAQEILVFGALGLRWDQTLANLLLLAVPALACRQVRLIDGSQEIFLVCNQGETHITGQPGDTVSLIPIGGDAFGITTQGLEYPLNNETLIFAASRGVSNVLLGLKASVSLNQGLLVCVVIHHTFTSETEKK